MSFTLFWTSLTIKTQVNHEFWWQDGEHENENLNEEEESETED